VRHIKWTKSLCPECLSVVDAEVYEEDGKVWIRKTCPEHGEYKDLYWGSYRQYMRALEYDHTAKKLENPRTETVKGCPYDCGICPNHKTHTVLAIIDVTNRCNLRCPICFANAGVSGYLYEPSLKQIEAMLRNLASNRPVRPPAIQFSGGEPTVREDLPEIVRMAREVGFRHIQVDSNGIRIAKSLDYCKELREAGVNAVYLQFDGVTPEPYIAARGMDLFDVKVRAIDNLRKAGFKSVVLVVTLVGGLNDNQIGDIIRFAVENRDIVRCVNFQPVSITGRIDYSKRMQMRITIPDLMRLCEEQTGGAVREDDWYPVPCVIPVSKAAEAMTGKDYVEFGCHPHCGMATYVFVEKGKIVPITRYADVDELFRAFEEAYELASKGHKTRAKLKITSAALKHVKFSLLAKYLMPVIMSGSYDYLAELHYNMIMLGSMHFMDPYNFDLQRVERCIIHYAVPDGRIIPFCTMNTIHRPLVERKFAVPLAQHR